MEFNKRSPEANCANSKTRDRVDEGIYVDEYDRAVSRYKAENTCGP